MDPRRYALHPHERQRVANYFEPGMPTARLESHDDFGDWTVLRRGDRQWVLSHRNGAILVVAVSGDCADSYELLVGDDAVAAERRVRAG